MSNMELEFKEVMDDFFNVALDRVKAAMRYKE